MFPSTFTPLADKHAILESYRGKKIEELPSPSFIVDRQRFAINCEKMLDNLEQLRADFRAHVKTHKTIEGTILQLGKDLRTDKLVVSTLMEAWHLVPLAKKGLVKDVLFSLPVVESRLDELVAISHHFKHFRLMLDGADQLDTLARYSEKHQLARKWSIFVKINMGTNRAGLVNDSWLLQATLKRAAQLKSVLEIYGFYCHAGHSYLSESENAARDFLLDEIVNANNAAKAAIAMDASLNRLQISVGATPTAHASELVTIAEIEERVGGALSGNLELHAGNYPFCDMQQVATGCVTVDEVSCRVIADVLTQYPGRGDKPPGEMLINAGVLALAREYGPLPGHGHIVAPKGHGSWDVGRLSQEHGILVPQDKDCAFFSVGTRVSIVPQHSCITAAAYPWFFVVDGDDTVADVWVPARGW